MKAIFLLALLAPAVLAWWDHGHMLTTAIPRLRAEAGSTKLSLQDVEKVDALMMYWFKSGDLGGTLPWAGTFEFCPVWPDYTKNGSARKDENGVVVMKGSQESFFDRFHYYNPAFPIEDVVAADDPYSHWPTYFGEDTHDGVTWFLDVLNEELSNPDLDPKVSFTISSAARQICFWTHMVGDLHMPLHMCGINPSSCYKSGDAGGNAIDLVPADLADPLFKAITSATGADNLHALWDSGMWIDDVAYTTTRNGYFEVYADIYHAEGRENQLFKDAQMIMDKFPYEDMAKEYNLDATPIEMAEESYTVCREKTLGKDNFWPQERVYKCADGESAADFSPNDAYITEGHEAILKQIALAGYRIEHQLANVLQKISHEDLIATADVFQREYMAPLCAALEG